MAEPFLGEVRLMSFDFPPQGWALCNGQTMLINQNQALFALLGVTYGGNGQTTFALPNLQGRAPIHSGNGHSLGDTAGTTSVTIDQQQMPQHMHFLQGLATNGTVPGPAGASFSAFLNGYAAAGNPQPIAPQTVTAVGGSQPHNNMMPYIAGNFCIALQGIFPSRN
jgi:microcystin-dependent protein